MSYGNRRAWEAVCGNCHFLVLVWCVPRKETERAIGGVVVHVPQAEVLMVDATDD